MAAINVNQILMIVSVVVAFLMLIAASITIDQFRKLDCNGCSTLGGTRAAGALAIIASLGQMGACGYILFKHFQGSSMSSQKLIVQIVHGVLLLVTIIAFSVGVNSYNKWIGLGGSYKTKFQFLNAMTCIDWLFCIGVIVSSVVLGGD